MWILIPSFEPDTRLVDLVRDLVPHVPVLVIDDGSDAAYGKVFAAVKNAGAVVVYRDVNRGKGEALRIGFAWLKQYAPGHMAICADSDGQHRVTDILRVGRELRSRARSGAPDAVVLGVRSFVGTVPLRSRIGNRATTAMVSAAVGRRISDTQTGLRGYPASLLGWAGSVRGERFAYELRLLLDAAKNNVPMVEVPIATIYLDQNASSHFRPLVDSLLILAPLLLFAASSLTAFVVDAVALLALNDLTGSLGLAVLGARLLSSSLNFALNRRTVFQVRGNLAAQILKYVALAACVVGASYVGLVVLTGLGMALLPAKIISDFVLWIASYGIQRRVVFAQAPQPPQASECETSQSEPTVYEGCPRTDLTTRNTGQVGD